MASIAVDEQGGRTGGLERTIRQTGGILKGLITKISIRKLPE
jgi:hypothetical protein